MLRLHHDVGHKGVSLVTFGQFFKLVEIRTKTASIIPFFMGTLYAFFRFQEFHGFHFLLMLISLLSFDMATTAINNYYDYKRAVKTDGYGYEVHNAVVQYKLKESTVVTVIITLLFVAAVAGFWIFIETDILIFLLGGLSFLVGILYSFGPLAISRMPLGELFSGLFMGFVILFISSYIHLEQGQIVLLMLEDKWLTVHVDIREVLLMLLVSIPAIAGIGNIMLANNICDMEEDVENKRYTLPVYIGKTLALKLFRLVYYVSYLDLIVLYLLGVHPVLLVLVLITFIPLRKNITLFVRNQSKAETFGLAVQNFIILNMARIVVLGAAILLHFTGFWELNRYI